MQSNQHLQHIRSRVAWNNCPECRADNERRFAPAQWPGYQHVHEYLTWARPRLEAIQAGENSPLAQSWHKDFLNALNRRIYLKVQPNSGRKFSHSYTERLRQFRNMTVGSDYLRRFAKVGASALE